MLNSQDQAENSQSFLKKVWHWDETKTLNCQDWDDTKTYKKRIESKLKTETFCIDVLTKFFALYYVTVTTQNK